MFKSVMTSKVQQTKADEAMQIVREFLERFRTLFPEQEVEAYWQRFDVPLVTFHWVTIHEDLAAFDRWSKKLSASGPDEKMTELFGRWSDVIVEGSGGGLWLESL